MHYLNSCTIDRLLWTDTKLASVCSLQIKIEKLFSTVLALAPGIAVALSTAICN